MSTLSKLFESVLIETATSASRHLSDSEKAKVASQIISNCEKGIFTIVDRDKNLDFINSANLSKRRIRRIISNSLRPQNIVCVVEDRNCSGQELYIISLNVDHRWIYMKVDSDCTKAISFHAMAQRVYPDYRNCTGSEYDDVFVKRVADDWQQRFNNNRAAFSIERFEVKDDFILFTFNQPFSQEDGSQRDIINLLVKSCPRDKDIIVRQLPIKFFGKQGKMLITIPKTKK